MTTEKQSEEDLDGIRDEEEKPHIPPQKISRFGPQSMSKFGKGAMSFNPPNKQRPGRAAGRGR